MQATGPAGSQRYTYDDRARLSKVEDTGTDGCITRVYGFTGDSNRTSLTSYGPDAEGGCQATTAAASTSYSYDGADRLTTSGYVYDRMGRSTTVPKVHTSNAGDGSGSDLSVTYAANDMVASLQQTVTDATSGVAQVRRQTFSLDGSDRVSTTKGFADGVQLGERLDPTTARAIVRRGRRRRLGINRCSKSVFRLGKSNWKDKRTGEWATGLKKYSVHRGKTPSEMKKHWPWQR